MRGTALRSLRVFLNVLLVGLMVWLSLSVAVSMGIVDPGPTNSSIDSPEPIPDIPIWEITTREPSGPVDSNATNEDPVQSDPGTTYLTGQNDQISSASIETRIHERINEIRAEKNLPQLDRNRQIASIARTYSADMATREYFSHTNPEGEGPGDRFGDLYPTTCRAVGENLAFVGTQGADTGEEVARRIVNGWMNSEGHRENILTARWDMEGIGVYVDGNRVYASQEFCDTW